MTFGIYTNVMKKPLSASLTFTSISLFGILRGQFSKLLNVSSLHFHIKACCLRLTHVVGWVSFVIRQILYALVSFKRIDKFLNEEEELEDTQIPSSSPHEVSNTGNSMVGYKNATLSWLKPESRSDNGFRLSNLDIECTPGGLTVVSGPVGSGKTSFLLGLLGEMRLLEGEIYLPRDHGVAYVSQTPWLQNATIRDNVLFGSEFDEGRYNAVIDACALAADIQMFEMGDATEVGERGMVLFQLIYFGVLMCSYMLGVTLSGGQKARLALARAVYSPTKIVLLDDVLSALDAGTIKAVGEKCLKGEVLKNRTVVLVTHQYDTRFALI